MQSTSKLNAIMSKEAWDRLPVVVTGAGDYVLRDGRRVTVHGVRRDTATVTAPTFAVQGAIWSEFRGHSLPRGYAIWHVNGRHTCRDKPMPTDIVGPWVDPSISIKTL